MLQCTAPLEKSVTDSDLETLGRDLYEIDREQLDPLKEEKTKQEDHEKEQIDIILQKVTKRWSHRRRQRERETRKLRGQILALDAIKANSAESVVTHPAESQVDEDTRDTLGFTIQEDDTFVQEIKKKIMEDRRKKLKWWKNFASPPARMQVQTNLLSGTREAGGSRDAKQRRFLAWLRGVHSKEENKERNYMSTGKFAYTDSWTNGDWGSPYSSNWPRRSTAGNITLEHIVCSEWLRTSEARVLEAGLPRQDVTITTLCNASENSSRSDKPLSVFGIQKDKKNTRLYTPPEITMHKKTRLAVATCHGVLCYPFVSEQSKQMGSSSISGSFGVAMYSQRVEGLKKAAVNTSSDFARRVALVTSARHRWHNPLVLRPTLLKQPRYIQLLQMRLRGGKSTVDTTQLECGLALLVDDMLRTSVEDAPK